MADRYNFSFSYLVLKPSRFTSHYFDSQFERLKFLKVYL